MGSSKEALSCCKKVADMLSCTYPSNSTAVAFHRLRLARSLRQVGADTEANREYWSGMEVLHLHFGALFEA